MDNNKKLTPEEEAAIDKKSYIALWCCIIFFGIIELVLITLHSAAVFGFGTTFLLAIMVVFIGFWATQKIVSAVAAPAVDAKVDRMMERLEEEAKVNKMKKQLGYWLNIDEDEKTVYINGHLYNFKEILNYRLSDQQKQSPGGTITSVTKTDKKSMVGRAVVGGLLGGTAGAIIGGATAKKTTQTHVIPSIQEETHDYRIVISVDNIARSTEVLELGKDEEMAYKVAATLDIIISRKG